MIVVDARGLAKTYRGGDGGVITVLDGLQLEVAQKEMVAIVGASGSGKSTLLHILGGLDQPTHGEVYIKGMRLSAEQEHPGMTPRWRLLERRRQARRARMRDDLVTEARNSLVGFVFQFHHLMRDFSAIENVMMPLRIGGWALPAARTHAADLLAQVGLTARMHHRANELSGGEQQRTAVARALAMSPAVLLADEPSGNLDRQNSDRLHDLFAALARDLSIGIVVVTHNRSLAARADRVLLLEAGRLRPDVEENTSA